jgi:hypothetical protein
VCVCKKYHQLSESRYILSLGEIDEVVRFNTCAILGPIMASAYDYTNMYFLFPQRIRSVFPLNHETKVCVKEVHSPTIKSRVSHLTYVLYLAGIKILCLKEGRVHSQTQDFIGVILAIIFNDSV